MIELLIQLVVGLVAAADGLFRLRAAVNRDESIEEALLALFVFVAGLMLVADCIRSVKG